MDPCNIGPKRQGILQIRSTPAEQNVLLFQSFLLTSHCSTSAHESPSTPSVLQTANANGSTVSSVISEPTILSGHPLVKEKQLF